MNFTDLYGDKLVLNAVFDFRDNIGRAVDIGEYRVTPQMAREIAAAINEMADIAEHNMIDRFEIEGTRGMSAAAQFQVRAVVYSDRRVRV